MSCKIDTDRAAYDYVSGRDWKAEADSTKQPRSVANLNTAHSQHQHAWSTIKMVNSDVAVLSSAGNTTTKYHSTCNKTSGRRSE